MKMPENARRIGEAASHGDLSENSEYKFALEERDLLRARVAAHQRRAVAGPHAQPSRRAARITWGSGCARDAAARCRGGAERVMTFLGPFETDVEQRHLQLPGAGFAEAHGPAGGRARHRDHRRPGRGVRGRGHYHRQRLGDCRVRPRRDLRWAAKGRSMSLMLADTPRTTPRTCSGSGRSSPFCWRSPSCRWCRRTHHWWEQPQQAARGAAAGRRSRCCTTAFAAPASSQHGRQRRASRVRHARLARPCSAVLHHAVLAEYVPFIVLLFSLYVIAGGIVVRGDIRATR